MRAHRKDIVKFLLLVYVGVVIYSLTNYKSRVVTSMLEYMVDPRLEIGNKCKLRLDRLSVVQVEIRSDVTMAGVQERNPSVGVGGKWRPDDCDAWQRVAIIVPYRDRYPHLKLLLNRLHPMLRTQKADYQIFVVEQAGHEDFNKGRLLNTGFVEALKLGKFDCFVFHDVDMLPESDRNLYYCDEHARHLSPALDEMRYHVMYYNCFGGVVALNRENFQKVNGYPNRYVGWGNEDDDMSARTLGAGMFLSRPPDYIGRYKMVRHMKSGRSEHGYEQFIRWRHWWQIDGLSNLHETGSKVLSVTFEPLYTNVTVDVGPPPPPMPDKILAESKLWFIWFFIP